MLAAMWGWGRLISFPGTRIQKGEFYSNTVFFKKTGSLIYLFCQVVTVTSRKMGGKDYNFLKTELLLDPSGFTP